MRVNAASAKGVLAVDVFGNDGVTVIDTGKLTGIDNQVDPTTGTLKLKAEFPNGRFQLWPGQFVNVRLKVDTLAQALVVPTSSVPVSYTHLDVYKRQGRDSPAAPSRPWPPRFPAWRGGCWRFAW